MAALMASSCSTLSSSVKVGFAAGEGQLIPKEKALEFVKANIRDADDKGVMLFPLAKETLAKLTTTVKGTAPLHYGYYGCVVEIREYKWPDVKGKPFALIVNGTAGKDTQPGKRIFWFETAAEAKDTAMALVALGAKAGQ